MHSQGFLKTNFVSKNLNFFGAGNRENKYLIYADRSHRVAKQNSERDCVLEIQIILLSPKIKPTLILN